MLLLMIVALLDVHFFRMSMITNVWGTTSASISDVIMGVVLGRLVICTNTNLVHPTWLADTIPVIYVSIILSMRPCMMLILFVCSFYEHACGTSCFSLPNIIFLVYKDGEKVVCGVQRLGSWSL